MCCGSIHTLNDASVLFRRMCCLHIVWNGIEPIVDSTGLFDNMDRAQDLASYNQNCSTYL